MTGDLFAPRLPPSSAVISDCGFYRYRLDRAWSKGSRVCWVMLNPSTADASEDDPTMRKITAYSKRWGAGSLVVVNLFAWRSTEPKGLPLADMGKAIGPEADAHIVAALSESAAVVCGWGCSVKTGSRPGEVFELIHRSGLEPTALKITKDGSPSHPLSTFAESWSPSPWPGMPPGRSAFSRHGLGARSGHAWPPTNHGDLPDRLRETRSAILDPDVRARGVGSAMARRVIRHPRRGGAPASGSSACSRVGAANT